MCGKVHNEARHEKYIGCIKYQGGIVEYHGFGCLRKQQKTSYYEGFFENGSLRNGFVKIKEGKKKYTGSLVNGKYEGFGKLELSHSTYVGDFKDNLYHGEGTWIDKHKRETYKGSWKQSKRHGNGILIKAQSGLSLTGEFKDNKLFKGIAHRNTDGMRAALNCFEGKYQAITMCDKEHPTKYLPLYIGEVTNFFDRCGEGKVYFLKKTSQGWKKI